MKILPLLLLSGFLFGCTSQQEGNVLPSERIVRFTTDETSIGYGVRGIDGAIFTASHVVDACRKWQCQIDTTPMRDLPILKRGELAIIGNTGAKISINPTEIRPGDKVYLLRFESGSQRRYDTLVTAINAEYIAYDATLSGRLFTGALEIGLVLDPGESGLPVWTSSGEFIGVVSASNRGSGKSYVVK